MINKCDVQIGSVFAEQPQRFVTSVISYKILLIIVLYLWLIEKKSKLLSV